MRCSVGLETIEGSYYTNFFGDTFCTNHLKSLHFCFSCHRPIARNTTHGGVRYPDNRTTCNICLRSVVNTVDMAREIAENVRAVMDDYGINLYGIKFPLYLVNLYQMNQLTNTNSVGLTCKRWIMRGNRIIGRKIDKVLILDGLSELYYSSVIAHEFMHVFLFMKHFPRLNPIVEEGVAELSTYLWLKKQKPSDTVNYRMKYLFNNSNPIYCQGFKKAFSFYKNAGLLELYTYIKKYHTFPQ